MTDPHRTLEYFEAHAEPAVELLRELVRCDTPTGDLEASRRFTGLYRGLLEDCGVSCREFETESGVHLAGDYPAAPPFPAPGGRDAPVPAVTFVVHSDTVWPAEESVRRPPELRDGKLFGPGVYDMKASLAQALYVFRYLEETGRGAGRRFRIFMSADEERGSIDARPFMEREVLPGTNALVLEPPVSDGAIKVARKGVGIYRLEIRGVAAHAGTEPHRGASATHELAAQILALRSLADPDRGVTINIGTVAGGTASNVVADRASATIDLRFEDPRDGERIDERIRSIGPHDSDVELEIHGGIVFPPMVPTERSLSDAAIYMDLARELGIEVRTGSSGGGSDGCFLASRGIATLDGLGIDGGGAHARHEHVIVDRIPVRSALLAEFALRLEPDTRA